MQGFVHVPLLPSLCAEGSPDARALAPRSQPASENQKIELWDSILVVVAHFNLL